MSKIKYLQEILNNFACYKFLSNNAIENGEQIKNSPLVRGRINLITNQSEGIKKEAASALYYFIDSIYTSEENYVRGCTFNDMSDAVFNILMEFYDIKPIVVDSIMVNTIECKTRQWFEKNIATTHLFIPCNITPFKANPFAIGPIKFTHFHDFNFNVNNKSLPTYVFDQMFEQMKAHHAYWIAELIIDNCLRDRANEIGDLAVDISLVAARLALPEDNNQNISRMTARHVPQLKTSVSIVNGDISSSSENRQPARTLDPKLFEHVIRDEETIFSSFGKRVNAFINGSKHFPKLNQSWNDATYWFHEGVAESLDTVAVPKLESAVEILLTAESSKGSESRILQALEIFYDLNPQDPLSADSVLTAKDFAKGLVRDRSRLLHGTWSTLATDMRNSRASLTHLGGDLLIKFSSFLDAYEEAGILNDNIDSFLGWVASKRQSDQHITCAS